MYSGYGAYDRPLAKRQVTQVSDPNTAWYAQEAHWILIEDLMGGTYGMRKKHRRYLPQEPRELDESYDNRLARSVVAPYYQRLERMLAGMLTRKPVRLEIPVTSSLSSCLMSIWRAMTSTYGHMKRRAS
jgi:hypothetical protein